MAIFGDFWWQFFCPKLPVYKSFDIYIMGFGNKFGNFCQNAGDFLVWTPGHTVEYSKFLAFGVYQFQCLCTYTYLYSTSIKNRCFLFIFLRVSAFSQFTLPTHPKVSWPVSLRCTIFCRTIFIECQIWICFKAVALINYFMLSMSKPDWNWPFCTNTYILLFYKMASSNQFSL